MMELMDEEASNLKELEKKIFLKHGPGAELLSYQTALKGGFLGLFGRQVVRGQCMVRNKDGVHPYYGKVSTNKSSYVDQGKIESEKKKILDNVQKENEMKEILEKLNTMDKKIDFNVLSSDSNSLHPSVKHLKNLLEKNDFSTSYIQKIISRIETELSVKTLEDYELVRSKVFDWIGDSISIDSGSDDRLATTPKVIVLVGPTGVGKTTTIAKLAADLMINSDKNSEIKTVIFTIDTYRIGAQEQIEKYGDIMRIPVVTIKSKEELSKKLLLHQNADYILIDTIGKSPRDRHIYTEMSDMLEVCRDDSEIYLSICATTKNSDIKDILRNFEIFNYRSVILTKLDETYRIGNIISILEENSKKLAYITTGQSVPHDIEPASRRLLMKNLEGFQSNSVQAFELDEVIND